MAIVASYGGRGKRGFGLWEGRRAERGGEDVSWRGNGGGEGLQRRGAVVERQRAAVVAGTLARQEEAPPRCSASVPCATEVKGRGGASAMAPHGHHLGHGPAQAWRWRGRAQGGAAEGCGPRHGAPAGCGCSKSTDRVWRPSRGTGHVSSHEEQSAPRAPPPRCIEYSILGHSEFKGRTTSIENQLTMEGKSIP